jgi:hypothetical protein
MAPSRDTPRKLSSTLFTSGAALVTLYVTRRDASIYGAAGAIVMLMLWVHYSAHAFFLGAVFTAAHAGALVPHARHRDEAGPALDRSVSRQRAPADAVPTSRGASSAPP